MPAAATAIEREVILLKAVNELIDDLVNLEMLEIRGDDPFSEAWFRTRTHHRYFTIVLEDLLSPTDKRASIAPTTYLAGLRDIAERPHFDVGGSVTSLRDATAAFTAWLKQEVEVGAWLPSIDKQVQLRVSRFTFIKMCGNISKHNFLRLIGVAIELQAALDASGVTVTQDEALLALGDFYDRFHSDILVYHGSTLAEFLNELRWGVHEYLLPEFHRSIVYEPGPERRYRYTYPSGVTMPFAKTCYWDLMNDVRRAPYVPRFHVNKWLKLRY